MNLPSKAALKTPALQTLRAALERQELAPAFGMRAALAPLFIRRSFKAWFRGSRREIFRGILSPRERADSLACGSGRGWPCPVRYGACGSCGEFFEYLTGRGRVRAEGEKLTPTGEGRAR